MDMDMGMDMDKAATGFQTIRRAVQSSRRKGEIRNGDETAHNTYQEETERQTGLEEQIEVIELGGFALKKILCSSTETETERETGDASG